jgi:hypothetical protein
VRPQERRCRSHSYGATVLQREANIDDRVEWCRPTRDRKDIDTPEPVTGRAHSDWSLQGTRYPDHDCRVPMDEDAVEHVDRLVNPFLGQSVRVLGPGVTTINPMMPLPSSPSPHGWGDRVPRARVTPWQVAPGLRGVALLAGSRLAPRAHVRGRQLMQVHHRVTSSRRMRSPCES